MNRQKRKTLQSLNTRQGLASKLLDAQALVENLKRDMRTLYNKIADRDAQIVELEEINRRTAAYRLQIRALQPERQLVVQIAVDVYQLFTPAFYDMEKSLSRELVARLKNEYMKAHNGYPYP
jgi:uncharacterized coiled-coil protein SlyX